MTAKPSTAEKIVKEAHALLGVHEIPDGSNNGPAVHQIQTVTKAYGEPWCVSFVQYVVHFVTGSSIANDTASVYYLIDYAAKSGWVEERPVVAGPVCYRIGQGHCGIVVQVLADGSFYAIEGNEANAVRLMHRDPHMLSCVFLKPPYLN